MNSIQHLLGSLSLGLALLGCTSPHLDALSNAECTGPEGCGDRACVDGVCVACGDEICDGFDNDCDGEIDEGFDLQGDPEHCGGCGQVCEGVCSAGVCEICEAEEEVCDGVDNDCDGEIDEGVLNACGACGPVPEELCDGVDNDCDGEIDEGALNACGACGPVPEEVCDGVDNDCDGDIDEGFRRGCFECEAPSPEICDGVDNDCDGEIDEAFEGLGTPCEIGEGACRVEGVLVCDVGGHGATCQVEASVEPTAELCGDEIDNDCDGEVDEGFGLGAPCEVGIGACAALGEIVCDAQDPSTVRCDATPRAASFEICNDVDDDCDGEIDEDFDFEGDPDHCGGCNINCAQPNTVAICVAGACAVERCLNDFEDLDDNPVNGCECNPTLEDVPDAERLDNNCDGIDGDLDGSLFVSTTQGVDGAGRGTADAPLQTLSAALTAWSQAPAEARPPILLDEGVYALPDTWIVDGDLEIHGGYIQEGVAWRREPACVGRDCPHAWQISGDVGASTLFHVTAGATLRVSSVDLIGAQADTSSAVPLIGEGCLGIHLEDLILQAGPGLLAPLSSEALPGAGGEAGGDGQADGQAGEGRANPTCPAAAGGRGGSGIQLGDGLEAGAASPGGAAGGQSAADGASAAGEDGDGGADGIPGQSGSNSGVLEGVTWSPDPGLPPTSGEPGIGGGGGGGGLTAGGGGGGAGGCGGVAGSNGASGGASIGVLLTGVCALHASGLLIYAGPGGAGGASTSGGAGGDGGAGGLAGGDDASPGGAGGLGGCGGPGAGGPGGPVIGVLRNPSAQVHGEINFELGRGGTGGAGVTSDCSEAEGLMGLNGAQVEIGCCEGACGDLSCPN